MCILCSTFNLTSHIALCFVYRRSIKERNGIHVVHTDTQMDMYTRSLLKSIVQRPSETASFYQTFLVDYLRVLTAFRALSFLMHFPLPHFQRRRQTAPLCGQRTESVTVKDGASLTRPCPVYTDPPPLSLPPFPALLPRCTPRCKRVRHAPSVICGRMFSASVTESELIREGHRYHLTFLPI